MGGYIRYGEIWMRMKRECEMRKEREWNQASFRNIQSQALFQGKIK